MGKCVAGCKYFEDGIVHHKDCPLSSDAVLADVLSCSLKYDEWNGDYDCDYEFAGEIGCEDCICNYENTGGRIDPRTGKKARLHFV